jgi:hypothetical protein
MNIAVCNPYHAVLSGWTLKKMPDQKSLFKLYYLSVIGRDRPEAYEWDHCPISQPEFEQVFTCGGHEGIGFVTAFPQITKIFRFSPQKETILDVQVFRTATMEPLEMGRGDGWGEFACYAEATIAAAEYQAWAKAASVKNYLDFRCRVEDFPVVNPAKLGFYWQ